MSVNTSSVNSVYNSNHNYLTLLKISHILAQRAHYKYETRFARARVWIFISIFS